MLEPVFFNSIMINQNNPSQGNQRDVNAILKAISERLTRQGQQEQGFRQSSQVPQQPVQQAPQMQQPVQQAPQMKAQEETSFDDNFSFDDLDFSPSESNSQTRNEINNLLRTYNNNKKSSYSQEEEVETSQNFDSNEAELEQTELSFDSTQGESEEFELDSFEDETDESESEEFELDSFEDESDEYESEEDFANFDEEPQSNVHFLNTNSQANIQNQQPESHSEERDEVEQESGSYQLAMQIEYAVSQAISECVQQWCQDNLESICREVIKDELRKTA